MPFTDRQVATLRPRGTWYEVREPGRTGLIVRVSPRGEKAWCFRYRWDGEQRRLLFGDYPRTDLAAAHVALADAKAKLRAGIDPGAIAEAAKEAERTAPTVNALAEEYLERHARVTMKPQTAKEDERMLNREILPHWRRRRVKDLKRRDAILLLDRIQDRGAPVMRNRVAGVLSRLFRFALDRGIIDASPVVGIRRLKETSRERFLTVEEIRSFWQGLDDIPITPAMRAACRWLLVTGARRAEVAGTPRAEIDVAAALWTLPAARAKNGRAALIPLPSLAVRVLEEADRARVRPVPVRPNRKDRRPYDPTPSPWLFPSAHHGKPITPMALTYAIIRHRDVLGIGDATVHDLRRTFATYHGELGTPPEILASLLNHAPNTITRQVYDRATNLEPKRKAMETWCAWLEKVIAGEEIRENVVPITRARREA